MKLSKKDFDAIYKLLKPHNTGVLINAVNARDVHSFLKVGRDFSNWIKGRITKYGFEENTDFITVARFGEVINQTLTTKAA